MINYNELESIQPSLQAALAKANAMQHSTSLQKFSSTPKKTNSSRRRKLGNGRISANSSATTSIGYAARISTKSFPRRPVINKSTSNSVRTKQKKHVRIHTPQHEEDYEDEGFVNDIQEDGVRHEEVQENIAKLRADIRKSQQVLQLVKVCFPFSLFYTIYCYLPKMYQ